MTMNFSRFNVRQLLYPASLDKNSTDHTFAITTCRLELGLAGKFDHRRIRRILSERTEPGEALLSPSAGSEEDKP
ncbi:hypothetical protein TNCV_3900031 [Trichonephila clavipes]|nr:hypothetical protein TNCV_3900031 [Trichonephila clavipes]